LRFFTRWGEAKPIKTVKDEETFVGGRCYIYKPCPSGGCDEVTIRRVARNGSIVALDSGGIYEVAPDDTPDRRFGTPEMASWCAATRK
jgi:hypothetical protein